MVKTGGRRERGTIRKRGKSYQVRVYAGVDPVTGEDNYLTASSTDIREAEKCRTQFLAQVDRQRSAATKAVLRVVVESWLDRASHTKAA